MISGKRQEKGAWPPFFNSTLTPINPFHSADLGSKKRGLSPIYLVAFTWLLIRD